MSHASNEQDRTSVAVTYLRVSTKEQAERDGDPEGYSIPAQREANRRKAEQLNATVIAEFVDRGESARSADRPQLQALLRFVRGQRVDYVIVHKIDRLARNRVDDVEINLALTSAGVTLVSATESIDETPSGMLLHGIMSSIAEFYSRNLATEVIKGMSQKAKSGGTVGLAPIGYRHVRHVTADGREARQVEIDPERAPHVVWAFEAYATGEWSLNRLTAELDRRGLRSRPTPKRPAKALAVNQVHRMLKSPYYLGRVLYKGAEYPGRHEPLVASDTWHKVQSVLVVRRNGEKERTHNHYLKSSVFCGSCGSRLVVQLTKKPSGKTYAYFICLGRHTQRVDCTFPAVAISTVEQEVVDLYARTALGADLRQAVETRLSGALKHAADVRTRERSAKEQRLQQIKREQAKLLQAHYADAVPLDLMASEQDRLSRERTAVESELRDSRADSQRVEDNLKVALDLIEDCGRAYREASPRVRRMFNQAVFTRILVFHDHTEGELAQPFAALIHQTSEVASKGDAKVVPLPRRYERSEAPRIVSEQLAQDCKEHDLVPPTGFEPVLPP